MHPSGPQQHDVNWIGLNWDWIGLRSWQEFISATLFIYSMKTQWPLRVCEWKPQERRRDMWYIGTRLAQAQPWIIPFQASIRPGPKSDTRYWRSTAKGGLAFPSRSSSQVMPSSVLVAFKNCTTWNAPAAMQYFTRQWQETITESGKRLVHVKVKFALLLH